jgi:hypothetical protein
LIVVSTDEVTVTPKFPEIEFIDAVMVTVPAFKDVNNPELLTVATVASEVCQLTRLVIAWVLASEYVPSALSCSLTPAASVGPPETASEVSVAELTVIVIDPETESSFAEAITVPEPTLVRSPAALVVATVESDVDQVTWEVMFAVVPSL